jgi:hypothetical protein
VCVSARERACRQRGTDDGEEQCENRAQERVSRVRGLGAVRVRRDGQPGDADPEREALEELVEADGDEQRR